MAAPPLAYFEFGVGRGASIISNFQIAERLAIRGSSFMLLTLFSGLPDSEGGIFKAGSMKYSRNFFRRFVSKAGVDLNRVVEVPGFYEQSLTNELIEKFAFQRGVYIVHIDCDLYSSTRTVLKWLDPLLDKNSIIIFDDWYNF